jgi:hypothetical protein
MKVQLLVNRTNHSRRISSDKSVRGNVPGDDRTCRDDCVLADGYATDGYPSKVCASNGLVALVGTGQNSRR